MYQNCIDKDIIVWEEPLIGNSELKKFKLVSEGTPTEVAIKFRAPEKSERTPLLITTNHHIWRYCSSEEPALRNRCYLYNFGHVFRANSDRCIEGNQCLCSGCKKCGKRLEPDWTSGGSTSDTLGTTGAGSDSPQHSCGSGSGRSSPTRRGNVPTTTRIDNDWEFIDVSPESPTGNDNRRRSGSIGREDQQQLDGSGSPIGCGGTATVDDSRSSTVDGSCGAVAERDRGQSRTTEPVPISIRRGDDPGCDQLNRLQSIDPVSKKRRISGRVTDALGRDIGRFSVSSVCTQGVPVTSCSKINLLPTQSEIPLEAEFLVESPVFNELTSTDWKCYLAYLRQHFLHA